MVKRRYRVSPQFQLQYSWIETLQNVGYITFYPCGDYSSAGQDYYLTTNILDSTDVITSYSSGAPLDIDFDIDFNVSAIIANAEAQLNFTHYVPANTTIQITITIKHVTSGGTETSLGAVTTANRASGGSNKYYRENLKVTLTSKKITSGEKLRITAYSAGHANSTWIYHDPATSETVTDGAASIARTVGTDFVAHIPFKVVL